MAVVKAIVDKLLTNVSLGYFPEGYISESILPVLPVEQSSGLLGKYLNNHLRVQNSRVGGRGEARRVDPISRDISTTYLVEQHALEDIITPDDLRNVELPFVVEQDKVLGLTSELWLEKEAACAAQLASSSVLTTGVTLSGTSQFNDYDNSDPISKFVTATNAVRAGCGMPPNVAWMDWKVANTLRFHPQLFDRLGFKYNQVGALSDDNLAMALGVEKIHIAKPIYNSAVEGQSDSLAPVWGKIMGFGYIPSVAQPRQVSLGYYICYRNQKARQVYKYPIYNPANSTGLQVLDSYQFKITNAAAGYLITDAIA